MFAGTNFLCCVDTFPAPKQSNPQIYQEQLKLFLKSKRGKKFVEKYGRGKFSHDTRLLLKRGGLFSVVKSWVRARQTAKSVAKTIKWCKARVSTTEQAVVEALVNQKQHNRLQSMISRELINLDHPFIKKYSEVVVNEKRPFGFIINLNSREKPENFEIILKVFFSSTWSERAGVDKVMKVKKRLF